MKYWWIVLLLVVSVPAFATVEVKNGKVTANVQSELLRDVINQIGAQGGVHVSIDNSIANDMVYANFQDLPIGAAIRKLLEGTDINYAVVTGPSGTPTALFISKSETPGAPPKKLDSRPIASTPGRGVITPIVPQPAPQPVMPQPAAPQYQPQNVQPQQNVPAGGAVRVNPVVQPRVVNKGAADQKPGTPRLDSVPTAGSFGGAPPMTAQPAANQPAANQPGMNQPGTNQPGVNQPPVIQPNRPVPNNPPPVIQNKPPAPQNNTSSDDDDDDDDE